MIKRCDCNYKRVSTGKWQRETKLRLGTLQKQLRCIRKLEFLVKNCKICSHSIVVRQDTGQDDPKDMRRENKGRPSKLTPHDKRQILRSVPKLRQTDGSFTSRIRVVISTYVSNVIMKCSFLYSDSVGKTMSPPLDERI